MYTELLIYQLYSYNILKLQEIKLFKFIYKLIPKLTICLLLFYYYSFYFSIDSLQSRYCEFENIKIHYKTVGSSLTTLIFIHGWGCDLNVWEKQFPYFKDKYKLVFIDLPGFGKSDKPRTEYIPEYFARAVKQVTDNIGAKKVILVGHSLGTPVCRQFIKLYPSTVEKFCDVDGVYCRFPEKAEEKIDYVKELENFASLFKGQERNKNVRFFITSQLLPSTPEFVRNYALNTMLKTPEYVGHNTIKNLIKEENWDYSRLNIPVLSFCTQNPGVPDDNEQYLRSLYNKLNYTELKESGHFIMMEKVNIFNKILYNFIENNPRR